MFLKPVVRSYFPFIILQAIYEAVRRRRECMENNSSDEDDDDKDVNSDSSGWDD